MLSSVLKSFLLWQQRLFTVKLRSNEVILSSPLFNTSFHQVLKPSSFPAVPFASSVLSVLHSSFVSLHLSCSFLILTPSNSSPVCFSPSVLPLRWQTGSVRSLRYPCPLASVRQRPIGVIMMDGVISRGAFSQEGWAHRAFLWALRTF